MLQEIEHLKTSLKDAVQNKDKVEIVKQEDMLPLRRHEILQIIRDHRQVSFDFIKRRFMAVSSRQKFYKKRGVTKGAVYEPI